MRSRYAEKYSSGVNNRSDEKLFKNRSDGSFYCFFIGIVELRTLRTSESSGTIIDSSAIDTLASPQIALNGLKVDTEGAFLRTRFGFDGGSCIYL